MTQPFATGKYAHEFCDCCDLRVPFGQLKPVVVNMITTGLKFCDDCWSPDHPQLQLGRFPIDDPQALRDPRPNDNLAVSRGLFGWTPSVLGQLANARLGTVKFTIA